MAHFLIVDDSPTDLISLGAFVRQAGHLVTSAPTASEGISIARDRRPDLILMDGVMPEMNPFKSTRSSSGDPQASEIPSNIVTSNTMETDRVWGLRQGARDFIVKPVGGPDLIDRMQRVVGGAAA